MHDAGRASLQQTNEMIQLADVKAAAVLALAGVLAGQMWTGRELWSAAAGPWSRGLLVVAVASAGLSVLLALGTLVPRRQETTPDSLYYYRNVARRFGRNREGFVDAWLEDAADPDATGRAVAAQIWAASMVAHRKFTGMIWSIRLLVVSVVAVMAAVLS